MIKKFITFFRKNVLKQEYCWFCAHWFNPAETEPTSSGRSLCISCYDDDGICPSCHDSDICTVECHDGSYICTDCYAGACDDAHEFYKDREMYGED